MPTVTLSPSSCVEVGESILSGIADSHFEHGMKVSMMRASRRFLGVAALLLVVLAWQNLGRSPSITPGPPPASPSVGLTAPQAQAEPESPAVEPLAGFRIVWSVANRFRLFRDARDFERHVAAAQDRSVLETNGRWPRPPTAAAGRGDAGPPVPRQCRACRRNLRA